jgi:hypothetical protein
MIKLKDLNKEQKILLLRDIAAGLIDPSKLTGETLVGTKSGDAFLSLMMMATANEEGGDLYIVCIGVAGDEAKRISEFVNK